MNLTHHKHNNRCAYLVTIHLNNNCISQLTIYLDSEVYQHSRHEIRVSVQTHVVTTILRSQLWLT